MLHDYIAIGSRIKTRYAGSMARRFVRWVLVGLLLLLFIGILVGWWWLNRLQNPVEEQQAVPKQEQVVSWDGQIG